MANTIGDAQLFTSESVCAGHPDKIADAVSDALVDALLAKDPHARTGIETVVGADQISLFGEIKTTADIDIEKIVRRTISKTWLHQHRVGLFGHIDVF